MIGLARVTLVDEGTGISRAEISNDEGLYSFTALNPATYTITAEKPRFKTLQKGVVVRKDWPHVGQIGEFLAIDDLTCGRIRRYRPDAQLKIDARKLLRRARLPARRISIGCSS